MRAVQVFYDFGEPACFAVHARTRNLWRTLPVAFEWLPFEAHPEVPQPGRPRLPEEQGLAPDVDRLFAEENLPFKPSRLVPNTNLPLRAALWCDAQGDPAPADEFRDSVFRRLYERGLDINHVDVLAGLVERVGLEPIAFLDDFKAGWGAAGLQAARARAEELHVRRVPTMVVGGKVLPGDAPWPQLEDELRRHVGLTA